VLTFVLAGWTFFAGLAILTLVAVLPSLTDAGRQVEGPVAWLALALVMVSAVPSPTAAYVLLTMVVVAWRTVAARPRGVVAGAALRGVITLICLALAGSEASRQVLPHVTVSRDEALIVVGDSLSAGLQATPEGTWGQLMARTRGLDLVDRSWPGATLSSAAARVKDLPARALVIVELGGNDVLSGVPVSAFERDLDALLDRLASPGRQLLMFDLPLLPLQNRYGGVLRAAAARRGAVLIPRWVLAEAIGGSGNTIDGLHLSARGHAGLAAQVSRMINTE
jgi:acyl-CoA thioesterase I